MRVLAGSNARGHAPAKWERLTLVDGQPSTIALRYAHGKRVQSRIPGAPDQMMYSLADGRTAYFPLEVGEQIDALELQAGEPFSVCKYGPRQWEVLRTGDSAAAPRAARPAEWDSTPQHITPPAPRQAHVVIAPPATQLEHALKTAVAAAHAAEQHATSIGYNVRFDADDIRAMAISVLIGMQQGERR